MGSFQDRVVAYCNDGNWHTRQEIEKALKAVVHQERLMVLVEDGRLETKLDWDEVEVYNRITGKRYSYMNMRRFFRTIR